MSDESSASLCFVISEIGASGSATRARADKIYDYVVEPAAKDAGFSRVVRADQLREPGMITTQIVDQLLEADVVVADLTGLNPNAFY
jgi:hypothetical protein